MFYFILGAVNYAVYSLIFSSRLAQRRMGSLRQLIFVLFSTALIIGQIGGFLFLKEKNLYEVEKLSRDSFNTFNVTSSQDNSPRIPNNIRPNFTDAFGPYILQHRGLRLYYDKYGSSFIEALQKYDYWGKVKYFIIEKTILETVVFYFFIAILSAHFSKKYRTNGLKLWCMKLIIACLFLELGFVLDDSPKGDVLNHYAPDLASFERAQIFKITLICAANAFRAYYAYFYKSKVEKMQKSLVHISSFNTYLANMIEHSKTKTTNKEFETVKEELNSSTSTITKYVDEEKIYKDEKTNSAKSPKALIALSILVFIAYRMPEVQNMLYNEANFESLRPEDYIKL